LLPLVILHTKNFKSTETEVNSLSTLSSFDIHAIITTMPSVLKATNDIAKRGKGKGKGKATEDDVPATGKRGNEVEKKRKDKTLLITSRGVTQRMRHLMLDLEALLPHTKKGECGERTLTPKTPNTSPSTSADYDLGSHSPPS
jgi:hypothetical protein